MKKLVTSYTFTAASKTVQAADFTAFEKILLITNVTDNIIIYNFADPTLGGTFSGSTLTLTYNTTSMSDSDKLQIFIDDAASSQPINDNSGSLTVDGTVAVTQSGTWDEVGINDSGNSITVDGTVSVTDGLNVEGDVAAGSADSGNPVKVGGKYNATVPTLTDTHRGDLQLGSRGSLRVQIQAANSANAITNVADNGDDVAVSATTDKLAVVNRNTVFDGTTWDRMRGDSTDGLLVNLGSNNDVSLNAGTNAIGKLAANSGVDIGDVDVTSIAAGDNNIGNVDIVTMPDATVVGKAAQDAAVSGNPVLVGARASAAAPTDVSADGDAVAIWTTLKGAVNVADGGGTLSIDDGAGNISIDDGGNTITVDGTVTANLGATDNAVLDSIDAAVNGTLDVSVVSGSAAGTEYTEGDTDATISGTAVMWEDGSDTLRAVSAAKPLPVGDAGGSLTVDVGTALPAGTNNIGDVDVLSVIPGTGATNLGKTNGATVGGSDVGVASWAWDSALGTYAPIPLNEGAEAVMVQAIGTQSSIVFGNVAHDSPDSDANASPVKIGGYAKATAPTAVSADGDRVNAWFDLNGRQAVFASGDVAAAATDSGNPVKVGAKVNTTLPTYTDGQRGDLQLSTRGALRVELGVGTSTVNIGGRADNADSVAASSTAGNLAVMNRNTVYNSGASQWDRMRGDATDGLLVNLGSNNDVTITSGTVTTVSTVTALGAGTTGPMKAEDVAHNTGDQGFPAWGVRQDTPNATAAASGDYHYLATDLVGGLRTALYETDFAVLGTNHVKKYYTNSGAVTDGIVWSPAAGKRWYVTDIFINTSAAATITLEDDKAGGDDVVWKAELAANSGWSHHFGTPLFSGEDAADLLVTTSAGNCYVSITGYEI